ITVPQRMHITPTNVLVCISASQPLSSDTSITNTNTNTNTNTSVRTKIDTSKPPVCQLYNINTLFEQPVQNLPSWTYDTTHISSLSPTNASKNPLHVHLARRAS